MLDSCTATSMPAELMQVLHSKEVRIRTIQFPDAAALICKQGKWQVQLGPELHMRFDRVIADAQHCTQTTL